MAYKIFMSILVGLLFVLAVALSEYRDSVFQARFDAPQDKIDEAEARLREMTKEHRRSLAAAQAAMREREAILEREKDKFCAAQFAIGNNPDFCRIDIPDAFRLLWQGDEALVNASGHSVPPAGTAPNGH